MDLAGVEAKYGPRVDGREPTHLYIIDNRQKPMGWIQWYRWADYTERAAQLGADLNAVGIDLAIGEREMLGARSGSPCDR